MGRTSNGGMTVGPGEGERSRSPLGGDLRFIVRGEQSNGEFRWKLGDDLSTTSAGSFVFIPRGLPHGWQNGAAAEHGMDVVGPPLAESDPL